MSDIIQKISSMLNSKNIPDSVKNAMNQVKQNSSASSETSASSSHESKSEISPDMIQNMLNVFASQSGKQVKGSAEENTNTENTENTIDIETLMKMKTILDKLNHSPKDDPRANLLLSLKPYLKKSRKEKVDQYVKLLNMGKIIEVLNPDSGGDSHDI